MVRFLLSRPIAVTMTFIAILLLGVVSIGLLPVSLMPDISIPEVTVQMNYKNSSARVLENSVVAPVRRQLMQVAHLEDIYSETRDGSGIIHLKLAYGSDINLAYIEINEKIDRAMSSLPRDMSRPKVIKASASDLPVFHLNLSLKQDGNEQKFMELSEFADAVIRKRIEQMPKVAMVDLTGRSFQEILIVPNESQMKSLGFTLKDLETLIQENNIDFGNLSIRDGYYQYSIRFSSRLRNKQDIEALYLKAEDRVIQLKDLAQVKIIAQPRKGLALINGQEGISLALIKQSDARLQEMEEELKEMVGVFEKDYPEIAFEISQDQTRLLDYSINNLKQSLLWGAGLAFLIMFFFLKDFKAPWLIGVSIPASLLISLLFFHIVGLSLNIISLSGLVLGIGMMIDNSIIVIDNIAQYRARGENLLNACVKGTNEVIRPLLSSVLTTCAVFIPMIFISGIAGAMFYDQAMAVTIGLFVSLLVSISILPVYYRLFYLKQRSGRMDRFVSKISGLDYENLYEKGLRLVFRNQLVSCVFFFMFIVVGVVLISKMEKTRLPKVEQHELMLQIDWNARIHVDENKKRVKELLALVADSLQQSTALVGKQQYLLNKEQEFSSSESRLYLNVENEKQTHEVENVLRNYLGEKYSSARIQFYPPPNLFEQIFGSNEAPLVARLSVQKNEETQQVALLKSLEKDFRMYFPDQLEMSQSMQKQLQLTIDPVQLLSYNLEPDVVYQKLRTAFNDNQLAVIKENQSFVPIVLGEGQKQISDILAQTFVQNSEGDDYSMSQLIREESRSSLKSIIAGKEGEYLPFNIDIKESELLSSQNRIREIGRKYPGANLSFLGSVFSNKVLIKQLGLVLVISLLLLYFILAAQFESLSQPLIVLLEVPIDVGGALFLLWLFGGSLNLMSLIGIIVMSGIIINDSILKIDTINRLRKEEGYGLIRAISMGGQRRLKPILMTSLTTILALMPFLFTNGLGADLQKPLAITVIGGMGIGTIVSLYFVPLCYYYLNKRK
ncbi:efflux RND transporter permease subunit [Labilibaculum sp. DW002]|uniref:Efflux RND transporter permease subunit n=1 Tax=Paralabilibaculum antarcticum TaxID=2912572 RepID=A0ABT5VR68_9BACT|nr:efflux RND transporter permease subunit [Labilibaculum sp. DW002]MDE5417924.1 efflux RND transporter permease subunit [Labilibaculum sp. DW002]